MTATRPFHVQLLARELQERKARNPRYSLRAFAHQLDMDPAAMCRILSGKQRISPLAARRAMWRLNWALNERDSFLSSVAEEQGSARARFLDELGIELAEVSVDPKCLAEVRQKLRVFLAELRDLEPQRAEGAKGRLRIRLQLSMTSLRLFGAEPEAPAPPEAPREDLSKTSAS